jgi:hypothetical protein
MNNIGLKIFWWNSLFFWVDAKTLMLKCYDMEWEASSIFFFNHEIKEDGLLVNPDFIFG